MKLLSVLLLVVTLPVNAVIISQATPPPAGGSPVLESFTSAFTSATATSITLTKPTGVVSGDLLLAFIIQDVAFKGTDTPSGWTELSTLTGGGIVGIIYYRISDGTEGTTLVVSGSGDRRRTGFYVRISGADTVDPFDVNGTWASYGSTTSKTINEITTGVADTLAVYLLGYDRGNANPFSLDSGGPEWTIEDEVQTGAANGVSSVFGVKDMPTAGLTSDVVISTTTTADGGVAIQFSIQP